MTPESLPEVAWLSPAVEHVRNILNSVVEHTDDRAAVVVSDARCSLARLISKAYVSCLPSAVHLAFDEVTPEVVKGALDVLKPGDLVVLIQSTSFRMDAFRIRVELFNRKLKVIEHPHLGSMAESEIGHYVEALAYDWPYYRVLAPALKARMDRAQRVVLQGDGETLTFDSPLEPAKLNTGDYSGMAHVGGQFPIGEIFTEARDLERVRGRVRIFGFADLDFCVNVPDRPITLEIEGGRVRRVVESTPAFDRVIAKIEAHEHVVWVRELGFGLNRAFSRERRVSDVGTYERVCGVHLSLGAKHSVFKKAQFDRKRAGFHVDVFAVTDRVFLDEDVVFEDGAWCVPAALRDCGTRLS